MIDLDRLNFEKGGGLVTVVCQDHLSGAVLMVAHADRESLERTMATGEMHYRSRTRGLWHKGGASGNVQKVVELLHDCDADAILARVHPLGPACHTGEESCFGALARAGGMLGRVDAVISARAGIAPDPWGSATGSQRAPDTSAPPERAQAPPSYTRRLLADRNLRLKKLGEEAAELLTACADGDAERAGEEAADLFYHTLVAIRAVGVSLRDVERVLARRHVEGARG
ncbi:MAG TPA: phosphoribosyl-ATP diphosphatase [Gemmatimonadaceae bacterium]|nr:phosphoribosyl-ATP diphosphatase [Gemmatimonadaceae bacterium]